MNNNNIEARQAQVAELYRQGMTERDIAKEIGVSRSTVFNDLELVKARPAPKEHARHKEVVELYDQGMTHKEIAKATGIGARQVRHIVERANIERQVRKEAAAAAIDWETLPEPMKDRLDAMRRQVRREMEAEFETAVVAEVQNRLEYAIKAVERRERDAARVLSARKGVFTKAQYNKIKASLHPDSRGSVTEGRLSEAFRLFSEADIVLMDERENPTSSLPSMDELLKRRRRASS